MARTNTKNGLFKRKGSENQGNPAKLLKMTSDIAQNHGPVRRSQRLQRCMDSKLKALTPDSESSTSSENPGSSNHHRRSPHLHHDDSESSTDSEGAWIHDASEFNKTPNFQLQSDENSEELPILEDVTSEGQESGNSDSDDAPELERMTRSEGSIPGEEASEDSLKSDDVETHKTTTSESLPNEALKILNSPIPDDVTPSIESIRKSIEDWRSESDLSISEFAKKILGTSKGRYLTLVKNPGSWEKLNENGRFLFVKMYNWLKTSENQKQQILEMDLTATGDIGNTQNPASLDNSALLGFEKFQNLGESPILEDVTSKVSKNREPYSKVGSKLLHFSPALNDENLTDVDSKSSEDSDSEDSMFNDGQDSEDHEEESTSSEKDVTIKEAYHYEDDDGSEGLIDSDSTSNDDPDASDSEEVSSESNNTSTSNRTTREALDTPIPDGITPDVPAILEDVEKWRKSSMWSASEFSRRLFGRRKCYGHILTQKCRWEQKTSKGKELFLKIFNFWKMSDAQKRAILKMEAGFPVEDVLEILEAPWPDDVTPDVKSIVEDVEKWRKSERVSTGNFANRILGKQHQCYVYLINSRIDWPHLKAVGRSMILRMFNFLRIPEEKRMAVLEMDLYGKKKTSGGPSPSQAPAPVDTEESPESDFENSTSTDDSDSSESTSSRSHLTIREALEILNFPIPEGVTVRIKTIIESMEEWRAENNLSQETLANRILGKTKRTYHRASRVSKRWANLSPVVRGSFVKMYNFLKASEKEKMEILEMNLYGIRDETILKTSGEDVTRIWRQQR